MTSLVTYPKAYEGKGSDGTGAWGNAGEGDGAVVVGGGAPFIWAGSNVSLDVVDGGDIAVSLGGSEKFWPSFGMRPEEILPPLLGRLPPLPRPSPQSRFWFE